MGTRNFMLTRKEIPKFLNDQNLTGNGAEIGVLKGEFSKHLLTEWQGTKLYLIDTWRTLKKYDDISNKNKEMQIDNYKVTLENIYEFGDRATIIREYSTKAAIFFPDNFFDFVFLDARHDFENVSMDLFAWFPKVKSNGYLMGHDYLDCIIKEENFLQTTFEVKSAVDIFAFSKNLEVNVINEYMYPSWYIKVP